MATVVARRLITSDEEERVDERVGVLPALDLEPSVTVIILPDRECHGEEGDSESLAEASWEDAAFY